MCRAVAWMWEVWKCALRLSVTLKSPTKITPTLSPTFAQTCVITTQTGFCAGEAWVYHTLNSALMIVTNLHRLFCGVNLNAAIFGGDCLFYLRPGSSLLPTFLPFDSTFGANKATWTYCTYLRRTGKTRLSICLPHPPPSTITLNGANKYVWLPHIEVVWYIPWCCSHQQLPHPPIERHQSLTLC